MTGAETEGAGAETGAEAIPIGEVHARAKGESPIPPGVLRREPQDPNALKAHPVREFNGLRGLAVPKATVATVVRIATPGETLAESSAPNARSPRMSGSITFPNPTLSMRWAANCVPGI